MTTSDYIALGVLALFALLGIKGAFRWATGTVAGLFLGAVVLGITACVCLLPFVGDGIRDLISDGRIVPFFGEQVKRALESTMIVR